MSSKRLNWQKLLDIDVVPWLIGALISLGAIGSFFGLAVALKCLAAGLVFLFVVAAIVLVWTQDSNENLQFQALSQQFTGRVRRNWLRFGRRYVRFTSHGATLIVWIEYPHSESFSSPRCHIEARGFTPSIQFEIIPRGPSSLFKRLLGFQRVTSEIQGISDDFEIFTDTPKQLPPLLTDSFKSDVRALYALGLTRISMSNKRLEITTGIDSLQLAVATSVRVFQRAVSIH